ncbi:uncharacterized protein LOC131428618 [Malaya genurostris]|uniref:uncharacterized protein LOC131428618 n=1 Tax=Malaya genurostris TaxID=325434 RepID=UPI0026F3DA12|nr:uncharacterized protein LOC131428618 [Malaya genurostris]
MESFRSLFLFNKAVGFGAYTFRLSGSNENGRMVSAWTRSGLTLFAMNLPIYAYFAYRNVNAPYLSSGSALLDSCFQTMLEVGYVSLPVASIFRLTKRTLLATILSRLRWIDLRISALGIPVDHGYENRVLVLCTVFYLIVVTVASVCALVLLGNFWSTLMFYGGKIYISYVASVLATNAFVMALVLLRRIWFLEKVLRQDLGISKFSTVQITRPKYPPEMLQTRISTVAQIYDDLYQLSNKISLLLYVEVIFYCTIVLIYGILSLFAAYRAVRTGQDEHIACCGMHTIWWFEYCGIIIAILVVCNSLKQASKDVQSVLGVALTREGTGMVAVKIRALMLQIKHNTPRITTWLFEVDLSMVGTMASFLFMMVQFDS